MKKRLLFILCLFSLASSAAIAQTKTVTNQDLEKFRQQRLQAERDYRENYAALGFPSPEELKREREENRKERSEFAEQIRRENLEREKIENEAEYRQERLEILENNSVNQYYAQQSPYGTGNYSGGYFGLYSGYGYTGYAYSNRRYNDFYGRRGFGRRAGNFYNAPGFFGRTGSRLNNNGGVRVNIRVGGGGRRR